MGRSSPAQPLIQPSLFMPSMLHVFMAFIISIHVSTPGFMFFVFLSSLSFPSMFFIRILFRHFHLLNCSIIFHNFQNIFFTILYKLHYCSLCFIIRLCVFFSRCSFNLRHVHQVHYSSSFSHHLHDFLAIFHYASINCPNFSSLSTMFHHFTSCSFISHDFS